MKDKKRRESRKFGDSRKNQVWKRGGKPEARRNSAEQPSGRSQKERSAKQMSDEEWLRNVTSYEEKGSSTEESQDLIVYGKNAVLETLESGAEINKLVVIKDSRDHTIQKIIDICKERKAPIRFAEKADIDRLESGLHQGVLLYTAPYAYAEWEDLFERAEQRGESPLIVVLDGITDPHNLGAIIRTAEAAGAHGIIIPKRGSAVVTSTVVKISSGAAEHLAVVRVGNLVQSIRRLKESGVWVIGTAPEAESNYADFRLDGPLALVIGSEGKGMSRLVGEHCDATVRIDMHGKTSSLNASVAAGVLLFEAVRQRGIRGK